MKKVNRLHEFEVHYGISHDILTSEKITQSQVAVDYLLPAYQKRTLACQEEFNILYLNKANKPIGVYKASIGGLTFALVDIKMILAMALKTFAAGMIISHNHPSGNLIPSEADKRITSKIKQACSYLDIELLDHIIIDPIGNHYSFADNGIL